MLMSRAKIGNVLRWLVRNWDTLLSYIAGVVMFMGDMKIGLFLVGVLLIKVLWKPLWWSKPIWAIRWKLRPLVRLLRWKLGKKHYWVHQRGIVKVVILERDGTLWTAMPKNMGRFCSSDKAFFTNMDDAVNYLVEINERRIESMEKYVRDAVERAKAFKNK